jgi:hypothetical protein
MKSLQGMNQYQQQQQQQQQQSSLYFNQIPLAWSSLFSPSPKLQSIGPLIAAVDARSRLPVGGKIDNPSSMITVLPQLNPTYSSSKQPAFSPKRSPLTGPLPSLNPNNISSLAIQIDGRNPLLETISSELLLPSLPPQLLSKENAPRISKHQASPEAYLSSFSTSSSSSVTPSSSSFPSNEERKRLDNLLLNHSSSFHPNLSKDFQGYSTSLSYNIATQPLSIDTVNVPPPVMNDQGSSPMAISCNSSMRSGNTSKDVSLVDSTGTTNMMETSPVIAKRSASLPTSSSSSSSSYSPHLSHPSLFSSAFSSSDSQRTTPTSSKFHGDDQRSVTHNFDLLTAAAATTASIPQMYDNIHDSVLEKPFSFS